MNKKLSGGVWSAAPTPLTATRSLDRTAIRRLAEHQLKLGINGVFIGGTCGEGPWLTDAMRRELAAETVAAVSGRIPVAVQVTDNSAARILDNINRLADTGVDIAVMAPPFFQENPTPEYLQDLYLDVIEGSPLPIGIYHRGKYSAVPVTAATVAAVARHEKVVMIKDSAAAEEDRNTFLAAKRRRPELLLLNGNEFDCIPALTAGYDGLLLGGASFTGGIARKLYRLVQNGETAAAQKVQQQMNQLMFAVFGGEEITCWLAGQKQMMVELGVFSTPETIINYRLTPECAASIRSVLRDYRSELLPDQN